ncbi:Retrovirus-related Pol polyprotein from transposon RE1-like protein [Drosera capensis]
MQQQKPNPFGFGTRSPTAGGDQSLHSKDNPRLILSRRESSSPSVLSATPDEVPSILDPSNPTKDLSLAPLEFATQHVEPPPPQHVDPPTHRSTRIKTKSNGSVERCKTRLVARGFTQEYVIDCEETFAPVTRITSMDVKNAFLNGDVSKEVYMKPPPCYDHPPNKVCRLRKALYGLKQTPRAWYAKFHSTLGQLGFTTSSYDSALFIKKSSAESEYRALADTTAELVWLRWLLSDMGASFSTSTPIHCDSQSAIQITHNDVFHEHTKHI